MKKTTCKDSREQCAMPKRGKTWRMQKHSVAFLLAVFLSIPAGHAAPELAWEDGFETYSLNDNGWYNWAGVPWSRGAGNSQIRTTLIAGNSSRKFVGLEYYRAWMERDIHEGLSPDDDIIAIAQVAVAADGSPPSWPLSNHLFLCNVGVGIEAGKITYGILEYNDTGTGDHGYTDASGLIDRSYWWDVKIVVHQVAGAANDMADLYYKRADAAEWITIATGFDTQHDFDAKVHLFTHNDPSGDDMGYIDNVAVSIERAPSLLPFYEDFENNPTNAGTIGPLDGQHGWSADAGAVVQSNVAYSGSQALQLQNAMATHPFDNTGSVAIVQAAFHARPSASLPLPEEDVPAHASAVFFVATNLHLVAYSNTVPVELDAVVDTNAWVEFVVTCDYDAQTWRLEVDGTPVAVDLPFYSGRFEFFDFSIIDTNQAGASAYVDDIAIEDAYDIDGDGIPYWWETLYFGGPTNADPYAICSNGFNTVLEAYIAGLNPNDPLAWFGVVDFTADAGLGHYTLQWDEAAGRAYAIYWTSNLLDGFSPLQTNYSGGAFTDTVHGAFSQGFYRLDVEIAP